MIPGRIAKQMDRASSEGRALFFFQHFQYGTSFQLVTKLVSRHVVMGCQ